MKWLDIIKDNLRDNKFTIFIIIIMMYGVYKNIINDFGLIIIGLASIMIILLNMKKGTKE